MEAGPPAEFSRGRPDSTPVSFFDLHGLPVCVQDVQLAARILTLGLSISPHGGEPVRAGLQDGEPLENPLSPRGARLRGFEQQPLVRIALPDLRPRHSRALIFPPPLPLDFVEQQGTERILVLLWQLGRLVEGFLEKPRHAVSPFVEPMASRLIRSKSNGLARSNSGGAE